MPEPLTLAFLSHAERCALYHHGGTDGLKRRGLVAGPPNQPPLTVLTEDGERLYRELVASGWRPGAP